MKRKTVWLWLAVLTVVLPLASSGCREREEIAEQELALSADVTLESLSLSPTLLSGGTTGTGTVTLSGPAPAGGVLVALSSSDTTRASVPASVTVAAGVQLARDHPALHASAVEPKVGHKTRNSGRSCAARAARAARAGPPGRR